jgi:uncharacterized membrane protein
MKTKTPQNNVRITKNTTTQCRNENKNTTKHGKNNEKKQQHNVGRKTKTQQHNHCVVVFYFIPTLCCGVSPLFLHCVVVFFFILTLCCGVFVFIPTLCCGVFSLFLPQCRNKGETPQHNVRIK